MTKLNATNDVTVVVGLGKTGLACLRHLHAQGRPVAVTDSRAEPPGLAAARELLPDSAIAVGGFDAERLARAAEIVISPGVSPEEPALAAAAAAGVPVLSEIELFARVARAPVIAITGSNGKSTVTTLVGAMAERAGVDAAIGGNLGTPALELLRTPEPALYVLELSSFQLEHTETLRAVAAVVLNISPDHMDRYTDLNAYATAKARIYRHAETSVINADDPAVSAMRDGVPFSVETAPLQGWGLLARQGRTYLARHGEPLLATSELRIAGRHNLANALAALALAEAAGLPLAACLEALRDFQGLEHRTQWVAEANGVRWYDDSKGTNVGATLAAVAGLPGRLVLIAGGEGKDQDFAPLRDALRDKARAVVLIGRDASLIEAALQGVVPVHHAADMDEAVRLAGTLAQAGESVLLSPACASFDMFSGYEERGRVFQQAARRWAS